MANVRSVNQILVIADLIKLVLMDVKRHGVIAQINVRLVIPIIVVTGRLLVFLLMRLAHLIIQIAHLNVLRGVVIRGIQTIVVLWNALPEFQLMADVCLFVDIGIFVRGIMLLVAELLGWWKIPVRLVDVQ